MSEEMVRTQIVLPKAIDKLLKIIKVEYELDNKSQVVELLAEAFAGELKPEVEAKCLKAMTPEHALVSKKRSKTVEEMRREMDNW